MIWTARMEWYWHCCVIFDCWQLAVQSIKSRDLVSVTVFVCLESGGLDLIKWMNLQ